MRGQLLERAADRVAGAGRVLHAEPGRLVAALERLRPARARPARARPRSPSRGASRRGRRPASAPIAQAVSTVVLEGRDALLVEVVLRAREVDQVERVDETAPIPARRAARGSASKSAGSCSGKRQVRGLCANSCTESMPNACAFSSAFLIPPEQWPPRSTSLTLAEPGRQARRLVLELAPGGSRERRERLGHDAPFSAARSRRRNRRRVKVGCDVGVLAHDAACGRPRAERAAGRAARCRTSAATAPAPACRPRAAARAGRRAARGLDRRGGGASPSSRSAKSRDLAGPTSRRSRRAWRARRRRGSGARAPRARPPASWSRCSTAAKVGPWMGARQRLASAE